MLDFDYDMSGGKIYGDSVKLMAFLNFYSVRNQQFPSFHILTMKLRLQIVKKMQISPPKKILVCKTCLIQYCFTSQNWWLQINYE